MTHISKTIATLLFGLLLSGVSGQAISGEIIYEEFKNFGLPYHNTARLLFNNHESLFIESLENVEKTSQENSTSDLSISIIKTTKTKPSNHICFDNKVLKSQVIYFRKNYITSEPLSNIEWQIFDETKKLGNILVQKAQGTFRGRTYEAWFTLQIPLPIGPWKITGLPGAILELRDLKNQLSYRVKSVSISKKPLVIKNFYKGQELTLREFVKQKDEIYKDVQNRIKSRNTRYANRKVNLIPRENQKEIIYEWEGKK